MPMFSRKAFELLYGMDGLQAWFGCAHYDNAQSTPYDLNTSIDILHTSTS